MEMIIGKYKGEAVWAGTYNCWVEQMEAIH